MSDTLEPQIQARYEQVLTRMSNAARSVGRDPEEVRLVVVTKGHSLETVQAAAAAGARYLGENYVEEAVEKISAVDNVDVEWHMIGHVQSRKARLVCEHFAWMHSLDGFKLARRLDHFAGELGRVLPVLLECNVSGEASKFGFPVWDEKRWPKFGEEVASILDLPNLQVRGLMTMPPFDPDPEAARPYFQKLCRLREFLAGRFPQVDWSELSMGMSNDFEVAIQEGATIVRVGTAIVGLRK